MRILVDDFLNGKQVPGRSQLLDDRSIRIVRRKTGKFSGQFGQIAKFIDRYDDLNLWIMLRADIKVLNTVSRRGMDATVPLSSVTWSPRITGDCRSRNGCW